MEQGNKKGLPLLVDIEKSIREGNVNRLKRLIKLTDVHNSENNIDIHAVILACKYEKENILDFLFSNDSCDKKNNLVPDDVDESGHNAIYYAIRSGRVRLLQNLIVKWPDNFLNLNLNKLEEIISMAYEELKLKNIALSNEMQVFVESQLIDLRFYSKITKSNQKSSDSKRAIHERIQLVLNNINILITEYTNEKIIDGKFICIGKFIAQNLHILKRQLKITYNCLPWEEIEFCLISFIVSNIKCQEINLFYLATLNKDKVLSYLANFGEKLKSEMTNLDEIAECKFAILPNSTRMEVIAEVIQKYPSFKSLIDDHQKIRDMHSMIKIDDLINLAVSANAEDKEDQIVIIRALQGIGEYLKYTLESPKLSNVTNELLLLSLSRNTRKIITDLRQSLSHAYSLDMRTNMNENECVELFVGVQNDIKKVGNVVRDILYKNKKKTIEDCLKKIIKSKSPNEVFETVQIFNRVDLSSIINSNFDMIENVGLKELIEKLNNTLKEQTDYEKFLFDKINKINSSQINLQDTINYSICSLCLKRMNSIRYDEHGNTLRIVKFIAKQALKNLNKNKEFVPVKEIAELVMKIYTAAKLRLPNNVFEDVYKLVGEILFYAQFETDNIKWLEELREKFKTNETYRSNSKETICLTKEKYSKKLEQKLIELRTFFDYKYRRSNDFIVKMLSREKDNNKKIAIIEMFVLDILSILNDSKIYLQNNLLFLDEFSPLLVGKYLRNHLAHDNALMELSLSDPLISIFLNAKKLTTEDVINNKIKIGRFSRDNLTRLKYRHDRNLVATINQDKMFLAFEQGNLNDVMDCIKSGADINGRSVNLWTSLHFAAKGGNIEILKFLLNQNLPITTNMQRESPLHIAAKYGRMHIVEHLLRTVGLNVDDPCECRKTPLHIASENGHEETVKVLIKHKANSMLKDFSGFSALHFAASNNHEGVIKILLEKEEHVDINETMGGFTLLHIAAENGYLQIVNFLLEHNANVNAINDKQAIPLHTAALNGHLDVVKTLISNRANVNARALNNCTPLHYAVENGHKEVASILLKHGAQVNATDSVYHTPLHNAASDGYKEIVMILLENKADVNALNASFSNPLVFAVENGHFEIVKLLVRHGANIHSKMKGNISALHIAAHKGHTDIIKFLIDNGAEINSKDMLNNTPLHLAVEKLHEDAVTFLINNKSEINCQNCNGITPLHAAAETGNLNIINILLKHGADINVKTISDAPLHLAALNGHLGAVALLINCKAEVDFSCLCAAIQGGFEDIVEILIKTGVELNHKNEIGSTALHTAVEMANKEIIKMLILSGAERNAKNKQDMTPLCSAIKNNNKEIVEILVKHKADINVNNGQPFALAVFSGFKDIVDVLLKNNVNLDVKQDEDFTMLQLAALRGHKQILKALITKGADVNAVTSTNMSALHCAVLNGHKEIVKILIMNGAKINASANDLGTPLHLAAGENGHKDVVEILLNNGADVNIKDYKSRTPLELAVANNHLASVKALLSKTNKANINAKGNDDFTLLHIAATFSKSDNLNMIEYLLNEGSDINAKNLAGSKPIHLAAREGNKNAVEMLLLNGSTINELGISGQSLLHYAALNGQLEMIKYLISKGADVNFQDFNGQNPIHIAVTLKWKKVVEVLLENGAAYDPINKYKQRPLDMSKKGDEIHNLLTMTDILFNAVKENNYLNVKSSIKGGAFINVKNVNDVTPLHHASWKGYDKIVDILLKNRANVNSVIKDGCTPLHYAAKFSHQRIVEILLLNHAKYNVMTNNLQTPLDFAVDKKIVSLLTLVNKIFVNVQNNNVKIINVIKNIKDTETVRLIMNACNMENQTLLVLAMKNEFPKVSELKQILQENLTVKIDIAIALCANESYEEALTIYKNILEKREEIFGSDDPGVMDVQIGIAKVLYKQQKYGKALKIFEETCEKQTKIFGFNHSMTLNTRSMIALVLHRLGKNDEAIVIFREVYQKQKEHLGPYHSDILDTQVHMALVLQKLERFEEALEINYDVFEKHKKISGKYDPFTLVAQNNIAMVLSYSGQKAEAIKVYQEVYDARKKVLGPNHSDTLRTLHNMSFILTEEQKYSEQLKKFEELYEKQKRSLGPSHLDTLNTQSNMGNILFNQGKYIAAFKLFKESFKQREAILGPKHPDILFTKGVMKTITYCFQQMHDGHEEDPNMQTIQKYFYTVVSKGDENTVLDILNKGFDVNSKDNNGRVALHYAVNNGHIGTVKILLKNAADATLPTDKGNTPLHTAASKGYEDIVEVLLKHVDRAKICDFINAKTYTKGTSALHVASENGFIDIFKTLLKYGGSYNMENDEGKTPLCLTTDQNIIYFLKLIRELFEDAKNGNAAIINKLKDIKAKDFLTITNCRNKEGATILQVAITNNRRNIISELLKVLQTSNQ